MSDDPSPRPAGRTGDHEAPEDPLELLRDRIRSTQDAVERLADEAANAASAAGQGDHEGSAGEPGGSGTRAGRPPRNGYAVPGGDPATRELYALVALLDVVRGLIPRELTEQLSELVRELLLLARALIDWYVERLELRRRAPVEVQDIPIS